MIRFALGPLTGKFEGGLLTIDQSGARARSIEANIQADIDNRRSKAPGYQPSPDPFLLEALAGLSVTILERTDPPQAPGLGVN
jgi:hypothetical protein